MKVTTINHRKFQGFALLEAMLTLFILTIGILGVVGLQTQAMQSGGIAMQRMVVSIKTQELIERMLANPGLTTVTRSQSNAGNNTIVTETTADSILETYATAANGQDNGCYSGTSCTPMQTAQQDIFMWRAELNALLPVDPLRTYVVNVDANRNVTLTVTWIDRGQNYTYAVTTQIQPLIVEKS